MDYYHPPTQKNEKSIISMNQIKDALKIPILTSFHRFDFQQIEAR